MSSSQEVSYAVPNSAFKFEIIVCVPGAYTPVLAKHSKHFVLADAIDIWLGSGDPNRMSSPGVRRACRSSGNPCNRSLGAPLAHIERSAYLGPRKPVAAQFSYPIGINLSAGSTKLLAFGARLAQPGFDSLLDEGSLELGHGSYDLKHKTARGCTEIEVVAEADKSYTIGAKIREGVDQMLQ